MMSFLARVFVLGAVVLSLPAGPASGGGQGEQASGAPAGGPGGAGRGGRPSIGLALSGGGARGVAHIGVLRVLEENRIPVDHIAGTSMGALIGGLYAAGLSLDELEALVNGIDWKQILVDHIPREDRSFRRKRDDDLYLVRQKPGIKRLSLRFPPGILDGQKIDLMLKRHTVRVAAIDDFDDLPVPFRAVAADIATGAPVVLESGDLALALRASMALPGIFAPRMIDGRLLVDGGISCNLPIDVVREMGADIVIAVDISTPLQGLGELNSVLAITNQLTGLLTRRNADMQIGTLGGGDILIRPELGDISTGSFDRSAEAIPAGVRAAEQVLGRLRRLSVGEDEYEAFAESRRIGSDPPVIERIEIANDSRLADGVINSMLDLSPGDTLDADLIEKELIEIYGLELFESVYYDIDTGREETTMKVTVRERSWGPDYIQAGMVAYDDFEDVNFNVSLAYTKTAVNGLGGEWRTGVQMGEEPAVFSEFYQPLDRGLRYFIRFKGAYLEKADNLITPGGDKYGELGLYRYGGMAELGRELGTWGRISTGIKRESGRITVLVGDPSTGERYFDDGELFAQFFLDELDEVYFPGSGNLLRVRGTASLPALGSGSAYEQGTVEFMAAASAGSLSFTLGGSFSSTLDDDAPYQDLFELGGFRRLSGLENGELRGQHAALLAGTALKRIPFSSLVTLNAGVSVEYGNVYGSRREITPDSGILSGSLFFALDTFLGPLVAGCGYAEGGRSNCYFCLGIPLRNSGSMLLDR